MQSAILLYHLCPFVCPSALAVHNKSGITNTQAHLDGQVERNKVVAEAIAADDVETTCAESFDRCARTAAVLTLVIQVVIQVTYHVPASIRTNTVV